MPKNNHPDTLRGIFSTEDLEKIKYNEKGYAEARFIMKERQRLKLEVSRVLDEEIKKEEDCLNKDNYEEQIDEHIFMIEMANRIKKRLGI